MRIEYMQNKFEEFLLIEKLSLDALNRKENGEYASAQIQLMYRSFVVGVNFGQLETI